MQNKIAIYGRFLITKQRPVKQKDLRQGDDERFDGLEWIQPLSSADDSWELNHGEAPLWINSKQGFSLHQQGLKEPNMMLPFRKIPCLQKPSASAQKNPLLP
eukprot:Sdes_comp25102_c0_seq1m22669